MYPNRLVACLLAWLGFCRCQVPDTLVPPVIQCPVALLVGGSGRVGARGRMGGCGCGNEWWPLLAGAAGLGWAGGCRIA